MRVPGERVGARVGLPADGTHMDLIGVDRFAMTLQISTPRECLPADVACNGLRWGGRSTMTAGGLGKVLGHRLRRRCGGMAMMRGGNDYAVMVRLGSMAMAIGVDMLIGGSVETWSLRLSHAVGTIAGRKIRMSLRISDLASLGSIRSWK